MLINIMLLPLDYIYGEHRRQFLVKTASFLVFGYCGWVVFPSGAVLCSANRSISSSSTLRRPSDARRTLHISSVAGAVGPLHLWLDPRSIDV